MSNNMDLSLDFYCKSEVQTLKNSCYFLEINELVKSMDFLIDISVGEAMDKKENKYPKQIYLSFSIVNQQGEIVLVDLLDYEHLTDATMLLKIDRKKRVTFFSWEDDEDFINSLTWIKTELKEMKKDN